MQFKKYIHEYLGNDFMLKILLNLKCNVNWAGNEKKKIIEMTSLEVRGRQFFWNVLTLTN